MWRQAAARSCPESSRPDPLQLDVGRHGDTPRIAKIRSPAASHRVAACGSLARHCRQFRKAGHADGSSGTAGRHASPTCAHRHAGYRGGVLQPASRARRPWDCGSGAVGVALPKRVVLDPGAFAHAGQPKVEKARLADAQHDASKMDQDCRQ